MSIAELAVKRPISIIMFFSALILFGFIAAFKIKIDLLPPIEYPEVSIITLYGGAAPAEIENLISRPIEEIVSTVPGVRSIRSESIEGASLIVASLKWGADMDMAGLRIREKVDLIRGSLPQDADRSIVARFDPNAQPIMGIAVTGLDNGEKLRYHITKKIKPLLDRIDGVGRVKISGGRERQVKIQIKVDKLKAYSIGINQILNIVSSENMNLPAGTVSQGKIDILVRTIGQYKSLKEIEEVIVKKSKSGNIVKLKDLASVTWGYKDIKGQSFFNGKECINISILKESGKNTVEVCKKLQNVLNSLPNNLSYNVYYDGSGYIKNAIDSVSSSAVIGAIIAALIIFIFLRSVKTSLVITLILPASILITLLFVYLKGITLNIMSLGGLALGTGMLVDTGIVVLESIETAIKKEKEIINGIIKGTSEVMIPLLASTLTSIVVFIPIVFLPGIAGAFFSHLAFTVTVSLITSYIISISLLPALLIKFKDNLHIKEIKEDENKYQLKVFSFYTAFLDKFIINPRLAIITAIVSIIIGIILFNFIDTTFLPESENNRITIRVTAPGGTTLKDTVAILKGIDSICKNHKAVKSRFIDAGYNPTEISDYFGKEKNESTGEIELILNSSYKENLVMADLKKIIKVSEDITIQFYSEKKELSSAGASLSTSTPLFVKGENQKKIIEDAKEVTAYLKRKKYIEKSKIVMPDGKPEIQVIIDRTKTASFNLKYSDTAQALRLCIGGGKGGKFYINDDEIDIEIRLQESDRMMPDDLLKVPFLVSENQMVQLKSFTGFKKGTGFSKILRINQNKVIPLFIKSTISHRDFLNKLNEVKNHFKAKSINLLVSEQLKEVSDSISSLTFSLFLSIILIYMIMAAQFESFTKPLLIMISVPLTISGVALALFFTMSSVNVISVMGMVMLVGIVVNNAIVLISNIESKILQGVSIEESVKRGSEERFRPVLMTTMTTIFAMIPLALGLQQGGELQAPMAIAVIGGLFVSTILTLLLLPVFYMMITVRKSENNG